MGFVFYDVETTGTDTRFDQITNYAAIRTDAHLTEIDRAEFSCRIDPHIVPDPNSLILTGRSLDDVLDPNLPSHYEMMQAIARHMQAWSPATFIGYNSIRFDEEMLRHALYRTLHNPYLTSLARNVRADALSLCRAIAFFAPGAITVPVNEDGKFRFKLRMISAANGISGHEAHDAMSDAEATLALCRLVMDRDPASWSRFLQYASKSAAADLVDNEPAFGVVKFRGNTPRPAMAVLLATSPDDRNLRFCLDLAADMDALAAMTDEAVTELAADRDGPFFKVRINGCPTLCQTWDVPEGCRSGLDDDECRTLAARVADDPRLRARLGAILVGAQRAYPASKHVEQQLYQNLPDKADESALVDFHAADWSARSEILRRMFDPRWRRLGRRLIYFEAPSTMVEGRQAAAKAAIDERLAGAPRSGPWRNVADALDILNARQEGSPVGMVHAYRRLLS